MKNFRPLGRSGFYAAFVLFFAFSFGRCAEAASAAYKPGNYDTKSGIFDAIYGFRTHNGKSLEQFLSDYGLEVTDVDVQTIEALGPEDGDKPGDVNYTVVVKGRPTMKLPCNLVFSQQILNSLASDGVPLEFIRRHGGFPLLIEEGDHPTDAMIFWIATGRCSKAY